MRPTRVPRMNTKALAVGFVTLALTAAAHAQTVDKAKLDKFFGRLAEKNKSMGSLVAAKDGTVLYARQIGFGRIDGTKKEPLTSASRFRIGSITKMFTGAMVLQLVEEGKLKLDDTLDKFFPRVPNAPKITIAHLLGHRSGIHNFNEGPEFFASRTKAKTKEELVALIAKPRPDFEPGTREAYSNSNYVLLGYILEQVVGKPYQEALGERITSRLGLKDTYFGSGPTDPAHYEVFSYRWDRDWRPEAETHPSIPAGAGAIISTPADLVKFVQALFDLKLVSKASLDQMTRDRLALQVFPLGGEPHYGHGGGIDGFRSLLVYAPGDRLAVAYTSNGGNYLPMEVVSGVLDMCRNKPFAIPSFESVAVSPDVLDRYVGVYSSPDAPGTFTVKRNGATVVAGPTGQPPRPLEATAQDKFNVESAGAVLEFDAAKKRMVMKRRGREYIFTKVEPTRP